MSQSAVSKIAERSHVRQTPRQQWRWFTWRIINHWSQHEIEAIFKCIFSNENVLIVIKISRKLVSKSPIKNIPALVQIMAWRRSGDKPVSEQVMIVQLTHISLNVLKWCEYLSHYYRSFHNSLTISYLISKQATDINISTDYVLTHYVNQCRHISN